MTFGALGNGLADGEDASGGCDRGAGVVGDGAAGGGGADTAGEAFEEGRADLALETGQLVGERGLRQVQGRGGFGDRAGVEYGDQTFEGSQRCHSLSLWETSGSFMARRDLLAGDWRWKEGKDVDQGEDMSVELQGKTMVVVGGGSGIGRRIAVDAAAAGARVILASRNPEMLVAARNPERSDATIGTRSAGGPTDGASMGDGGIEVAKVDLADEDSIVALAERVGTLDYLVSVANSSANGPLTELERDAVVGAFDAKVIGAILLAKHFGPRFADGGAMLLFSGIVGWRPSPGKTVTAATNGAVSFLASALATELAPIRVNAISPGIIDSGAWDGLGEGKQKLFDATAAKVPARRIGQLADISSAAFLALTNPFITGETLHVDGGARYA